MLAKVVSRKNLAPGPSEAWSRDEIKLKRRHYQGIPGWRFVENPRTTRRKKRLRTATIMASLLALAEVVVFSAGNRLDPLSLVGNFAFALAFGIPLLYGLLSLRAGISGWWGTRHPPPPSPDLPSIESFSWTGRPIRAEAWKVVAAVLVLGAMAGAALIMMSSESSSSFLASLLAVLTVAVIAMLALGIGFLNRTMTFEVDERGVRTVGVRRASFDLEWKDVGRIEFMAMEKMGFPFFEDIGPPVLLLRTYAFLDRSGRFLAGLPPPPILNRELSGRMEAALLTQAARHDIPTVEVRLRDAFRWRKPKPTSDST